MSDTMNSNRQIPKTWNLLNFSESMELVSTVDKKIQQKDYLKNGKLPVVDQSKDEIGGFTNNIENKIECKLPVIVFGDHTKVKKFINYDFAPGADGIKILKPLEFFEPKLFYYFLHCIRIPDKGYARHFQFFKKESIPLPPYNEQTRIVEKIEELFSELDAGINYLQGIRLKLKSYRQSVLKAAFEGKLTKEWREEHKDELEPAEKLIERIRQEKEEQYKLDLEKAKKDGTQKPKKPIDLPPVDTCDLPELPDGWEWIHLDEISNKITDGEHIRPKVQNEGVPFLSAKDIHNDEIIFKNSLFVSLSDAKKFWKRCNPELGDILVVSRGATVGRCSIVKTERNFCLLGSVILIKSPKLLNNKYIVFLLKSPFTNRILLGLSGSTAQQAIYIRDIKNTAIALCSFEEQLQIVEEIESRLSVTDKVEQTVDENLKKAESLRQSILKKAFEGRLVPQDPNDEPAEKLLEQIKKQKAEIEFSTKKIKAVKKNDK